MMVKELGPVLVNGKESGMVNYAYFHSDGTQTSATFQATARYVRNLIRVFHEQ